MKKTKYSCTKACRKAMGCNSVPCEDTKSLFPDVKKGTYITRDATEVEYTTRKLPASRTVITWTPNYMVKPAKIVYDSSIKRLSHKDYEKVFVEHHEKGEDSETRIFHTPSSMSNEEVLKFVNSNMEIASPVNMFWGDVGVIARRFMREIMDGQKNKNLDLTAVIKKYKAKIKESSKLCKYPLNKRNTRYL